ncbi:MAG: vWA domain-containing protein [Nanoarchaeota archaeon]
MGVSKGFYFSVDALLAAMLLLGSLILINRTFVSDTSTNQIEVFSRDMLNALNDIRIDEVDDPWVRSEIESGNITDLNNSVLFQIGLYWATNETEKARNLSRIMVEDILPPGHGINVTVGNDTVYVVDTSRRLDLAHAERMITGIAKGNPLKGSTSVAYLRRVRDKRTASYAFFGGYVGQGNITVFIDDMPADVTSDDVTDIMLELDVPQEFEFYINGAHCDDFTPSTSGLEAERFNATHCNASITTGYNEFVVVFDDDLNESYIAGGFLRIRYITDEFQHNVSYGLKRYYFPGVDGVVNLYDAFYIPGNLTNLSAHIIYKSTETSYLTVGNREVWSGNSSGAVDTIDLDDSWFQNNVSLNYEFISNTTVPVRFAAFNRSYETITGGDADIVIITDFSGSMKKAINNITWLGHESSNCAEIFTYTDARRTDLATCLDQVAVGILLNGTGTKVWHVEMHDNAITTYDVGVDPTDLADSLAAISNFGPQGKGKTCLGCALNAAYNVFSTYSGASRQKFVLFMTDGVPTHCAKDDPVGCHGTSTQYATSEVCGGFCDVSGTCIAADTEGCNDGLCDDAVEQTLFSAHRLYDDLDVKIYSVAFGDVDQCTTAQALMFDVADYSNGSFFASQNTTELKIIYENISYQILAQVNMSSQTVVSKGTLAPSMIDEASYLEFSYTPYDPEPLPNQISVVFETDKFTGNCSGSYELYQGVTPYDVRLTSYSGPHWTDYAASNGEAIFNLSDFILPYGRLGDPYQVHIPTDTLQVGMNSIVFTTGDDPVNDTECSLNNSIVYTGFFNSTTSRSVVVESTEGCVWTIEFEDGSSANLSIPVTPQSTKNCSYTSSSISYDVSDAYDVSVFGILQSLDFDDDGRVLLNLDENDLEIVVNLVSQVPYLWGPTLVQVDVWR